MFFQLRAPRASFSLSLHVTQLSAAGAVPPSERSTLKQQGPSLTVQRTTNKALHASNDSIGAPSVRCKVTTNEAEKLESVLIDTSKRKVELRKKWKALKLDGTNYIT